jgi:hypothetical protein
VNKKYEQKPNTATVFVNDDKRPDQVMKNPDGSEWIRQDADYKGSGLIDGKMYWVDMHRKVSKAGKEYYAIKVKPKGQPPAVAKAANSGLTEDNWATFKDDDINF